MIRSGLVNNRRGGGFENGYTHQRDNTPRDEIVRPYVDGFDTGMGTPTNFSFVVPKPVTYADIFSKRATPDERLYLLKMVQKGVSQIASSLNKGRPKMESIPLTSSSNMPPVDMPPKDDGSGGSVTPTVENSDFMIGEDTAVIVKDEIEASDVVFAPVHQITFKEEDTALNKWINADFENRMRNLLPKKHMHSEDDVTYPTDFDDRYNALKPLKNGFQKSKNNEMEFQALIDSVPSVPQMDEMDENQFDQLIQSLPDVPFNLDDSEIDILLSQMPSVPMHQMSSVPMQSIPGGYPGEKNVKVMIIKSFLERKKVAKKNNRPERSRVVREFNSAEVEIKQEIKVNGVGPRKRTEVRKRGMETPASVIKKYHGPRYSQKPEPKGRMDYIGESVRRMKRNASERLVEMDVDKGPRNKFGLTVDTTITNIDKKAPKVRRPGGSVPTEMKIPDVNKKSTLRKRNQ